MINFLAAPSSILCAMSPVLQVRRQPISSSGRLDRGDCAVVEKNGDAEFGPAIGVAAAARCGRLHLCQEFDGVRFIHLRFLKNFPGDWCRS